MFLAPTVHLLYALFSPGAHAREYFVQTPDRRTGVGPASGGVGFVAGFGRQPNQPKDPPQLGSQGQRPQVPQEDLIDLQLDLFLEARFVMPAPVEPLRWQGNTGAGHP
jgi:hypothetical protein